MRINNFNSYIKNFFEVVIFMIGGNLYEFEFFGSGEIMENIK